MIGLRDTYFCKKIRGRRSTQLNGKKKAGTTQRAGCKYNVLVANGSGPRPGGGSICGAAKGEGATAETGSALQGEQGRARPGGEVPSARPSALQGSGLSLRHE